MDTPSKSDTTSHLGLNRDAGLSDHPYPRTWIVLGDKQGDNTQVKAVVEALGWDYEHKYIRVLPPFVYGKPRVAATLYHIDQTCSDRLKPPWPDLIITSGRRPANVALWIRQQSGNQCKIVLLGKPSGLINHFDLIIHSSEIQMIRLANVMRITLPLMYIDKTTMAKATDDWQDQLANLPRPLIGLFIGGPTVPYAYDSSVPNHLIEFAKKIIAEGGTPYFSSSRRSPAAIVKALKHGLPKQAMLHEWTPDSSNNPYFGLLGLADGFVVTGDSISMMTEIALLQKPLAIFSLPLSRLGAIDQIRRSFASMLFAPTSNDMYGQLRRYIATALFHLGILSQTRDFRGFHQLLINKKLAIRFGDEFSTPLGNLPDDLIKVVDRIKRLMGLRQ